MKKIILSFLVVSWCYITYLGAESAHEQTSTIRDYHKMEKKLLFYLKNAIAFQKARIHTAKIMRRNFVGGHALKFDPYRYASDPIQQFKLTKRFGHQWKEIQTVVFENPIGNALAKEYQTQVANFSFPSLQDFRGVVNNYLNIQRDRNVPVKKLADGDYPGAKQKIALRSSDCHAIASYCIYDPEKIGTALEWLREAHARLDQKKDWRENKRKVVLDLAYALSQTGHTKEAVELTGKLAKTPEFNDYHFIDMHLYFKARDENRATNDLRKGALPAFCSSAYSKVAKFGSRWTDKLQPICESMLAASSAIEDEIFWKKTFDIPSNETTLEVPLYPPLREQYLTDACTKKFSLPPSYIAKLKCRYSTQGSPLFVLSPVKEEELYLEPKISIYRNFLTDSETEGLVNAAHRRMRDSQIHSSRSRASRKSGLRSSKLFIFGNNEENRFQKVITRTNTLTALSGETAERLQVTYYEAGGFYTSHYDAFPVYYALRNGNRIATVLFYLNDDLAGGETAFYDLNIVVKPEKGSALVWDNLYKNGLINIYSGHGACPVLRGHKWIATQFLYERGQMFHRPCSLKKDE